MRSEEYKKKLMQYFKKNLAKGYTVESLKWALIKQGYPRVSVDITMAELHKELAKTAPVFKENPRIKYEVMDFPDSETTKKPFWKRIFGL